MPEQTRRQVDEERRHLVSAQLLLHKHLAVLVDSVDLEHVLRQVDANSRKLPGGRIFSVRVIDQRLHFGTAMPLWVGGVHPIVYAYRTGHRLQAHSGLHRYVWHQQQLLFHWARPCSWALASSYTARWAGLS
jgi:hypothetical protein